MLENRINHWDCGYLMILIVSVCTSIGSIWTVADIIVWREDLFSRVGAPIERAVRKEIKESSIPNHVDYLLAAWPAILRDGLFDELREANLKVSGGFVVCGHEGYRLLLPILKEIGVTVLFTPYVNAGETYDGIDLVPFPLTLPIIVGPAKKKDIYYSFIGCMSHPIRELLFSDMEHPPTCIIKSRPEFHWNTTVGRELQKERAEEYRDVLSRSRFSLCPRGKSTCTYRIRESMFAGAIPVIMSDDIILPLEDVVDWSSAVIRIPEANIKNIPQILSEITLEQERIMRENCIEITNFFEGKGILKPIYHYYGIPFE